MRTLSAKLGALSNADGSCDLSQGSTTALVSVYGPTEARLNRELIDRAYIDVMFRPSIGVPTCTDKFSQDMIEHLCESAVIRSLHPRTAINITIQVLETDGSILACCINCVTLALMDAAVPMKYQLAAVCLSVKDGCITIDPTLHSENTADCVLTVVFESKSKNAVVLSSTGVISPDMLKKCITHARDATNSVFDFYKSKFEDKLKH